MRIVLVLVIAAFAIYSLLPESPKISLSGISLETKSQDKHEMGKHEICKGSAGCIGVYMAPWCGSCLSMIPAINEMRSAQNASSANIIVVLGSDSKQKLIELSSKIPGKIFIDSEGKFSALTRYSSVPRWFVINNQQEIIKSFTLRWLPDGNAEQKVEYLIKEYAGFLAD